MILVLAGTKDGRLIAAALEQAGFSVLATAVTSYGEDLLAKSIGGRVLCGALDAEGMCRVMEEHKVKMVVDATHPFAEAASCNAVQACTGMKIPYLRFEREEAMADDGGNIIWAGDMQAAIREVKHFPGNIFLAVGSSSLPAFVNELGPERLIVRVLPTARALSICEKLKISPARIVALQGPFSQAFNREMFLHYRARVIVSKESGKEGGLPEKLAAAKELDLPVVVIRRPSSLSRGRKFSSVPELLDYVKARLQI
jgi:precorrin-6A/cobalt-precorrin-6A reductase